jgi:hypothetical protein
MVKADGIVVDKVYHPYVDALERELEFRSVIQDRQKSLETPAQIHQLSIGTAIGDSVFAEFYVIGAKTRLGTFEMEAWEAEVKWQLTEQGEYSIDWGVLVEYENEVDQDIQEITLGILGEKEFGQWSAAANLMLINEWGDDINNEFETALALQARYRMSRAFEPGIEFYAGQNSRGIGPVIQGTLEVGTRKRLHWETGAIFGLGSDSPDSSFRFLIEFEF